MEESVGRGDDFYIEPIPPSDLTEGEKILLVDFAEKMYDECKVDAVWWVQEALENRCRFWRIPGGLVITRITQSEGKRNLVMAGLMGKGVVWNLAKVHELMKRYGKVQNCDRLVAFAPDERLRKFYERMVPEARREITLVEDLT